MLLVSCSAMITLPDIPYSYLGRDALFSARCAPWQCRRYLRLRALLSFRPLCTVYCTRSAPLQCRRYCDSTQLCSQEKYPPQMLTAAPSSEYASTKAPEARAALESRLITYSRYPKTLLQVAAKAGASGG